MPKFLNNINLEQANDIQFKTTAGANAGKISQDGTDLVLTNAVGDIIIGNGNDDVYIGDGVNNVDIRFEQNMAIYADSASTRTLTLGGANTSLILENPTLNNPVVNSKMTFGTANGYILFDYEPSGDTGEYTTEVPLLKIEHGATEKTILSRVSENGALMIGYDDTVAITAGDTRSVIKSNMGFTAEEVILSAEQGFRAFGFPNNDTTWSNRNVFRFQAGSATASDNGLYIGDSTSNGTQFIDLDRNLKNLGAIYDTNGSAGTAGQILSSTGSAIDWIDNVAGSADKALSLTLTVKNTEAVALSKGDVVCAAPSATPPSGNVIEIKRADNNGTNSMPAVGILNEDLDAAGGANDEGEAIMFGRISGIDTSAFSVGDELFVSDSAGGLTATKPTGVKYIQKIGVVMRDDASNGTIEIFGAGRTNDVPTPLYIDHANQRLGIGATSPSAKLHTVGSGLFSSTSYVDVSVDQTDSAKISMGITSGTPEGFINVVNTGTGHVTASDPSIKFLTNSSEKMRITNAGKVGIGTTSPTYKFEVSNGTQTGTFNPNASGFMFLGSTSSDPLYLGAADSIKMAIQTNGNVGIGTQSPATKLDVNGDINISTISNSYKINNITTLDHSTTYTRLSNPEGAIGLYVGDSADRSNYYDNNFHKFRTAGGSTALMYLNTTGLGIGTTNPTDKLHVEGTSFFGGDMHFGSAVSGLVYKPVESGSAIDRYFLMFDETNNASYPFLTNRTPSGDVVIKTGTASGGSENEHFRIKGGDGTVDAYFTNANVGIGTTSPSAKLDSISPDGNTGSLRLGRSDNSNYWDFNHAGNDLRIFNTAGSGSDVLIGPNSGGTDQGNRLAIGTAVPTQRLHVSGNIRVTGAYYDSNNSAGTSGQVLSSTATGTDWVSLSEISGVDGSGTANTVAMWSDGDTITDAPITISGNNATFAGNIITSSNSAVIQTPRISMEADGTLDWGVSRDYGTLTFDTGKIVIRALSGKAMELQTNGATTALTLNTSQNATFAGTVAVQGTGDSYFTGNVGIGTTSPGQKLHVDGNIRVGDSADIIFSNRFYALSNAHVYLLANSGYDLKFYAGGTEKMVVESSGNVGIGTTSPSEKLEVVGNTFINGQIYGGFGAETTGGTTDWNHSTNARSGNGYTLLRGNASNGPAGAEYYHPFSFEYSTKNSTGNLTQFAIPYSTNDTGMYFRSRYSSTWTGWTEIWTSNNDGASSGLDADLLDGQHGSHYLAWANFTGVPSTFTPSAHTLDSHSNVTITSNSSGEILKWDGSAWVNNTLAEAGIAAASHTHAASDITSGTFADARIALTNITQHTDPKYLRSNAADTATGKITLEGNSAAWDTTTPGTTTGSLHFDPGVGTDHFGNAITFGASDSSNGTTAQAGIYLRTDGSYGSRMYFATTDSYASGSKVAMYINHNKDVYFLDNINVAGDIVVSGTVDGVDVAALATSVATKLPLAGGTMTGNIAMSNNNITGVNQLEINDPGEGIIWKGGSSGDITLAVVDDASDNILRLSGTNAELQVGTNRVLTTADEGSGNGLDADTLDGNHASAFASSSHNHDSDYVNVTGDTMTGDLILDDGSGESPHIVFQDDDDIKFRVYNADNNNFYITREGNSGADFIIYANASDYTSSYLTIGGATVSPTKISNWNTAYSWGDHSGLYAAASHTHAAADITSGTFADARIALTNITQHTDPKYLRSNADDTTTGVLTIGDGSNQARLKIQKADNNTSNHIEFYNGTTLVGEIGVHDSTWLRINQHTAKNIYTPRYIRADGGFFVDGTSKGINGSGNFIGGTIAGASDANVSNWDTAYNNSITSATVTGTTTKTLTLNQQDGGTVTASWTDADSGVTSVSSGDGIVLTGTSAAPVVNIDYTGSDNAILSAVDASGSTIGTGAKIWYSDDGTIAHANVSDLPFASSSNNFVDGSGTANYVTKWTDADTITNSLIYDDGTNIVINGADNNSGKADFAVKATGTTANVAVSLRAGQFQVGNTDINYEGRLDTSSTAFTMRSWARDIILSTDSSTTSHNIRFYPANAGSEFEAMRITSAGNVGIGTTSPSAKLVVKGADSAANFADYGIAAFENQQNEGLSIGYDTNDNYSWLYSREIGVSSRGLRLNGSIYVAGVNGNVGIGTTSPAKKFEVNGTVHLGSGGNDVTIGNSSSSIIFMLRAGYNYIQASSASGQLVFRTGGPNNRMVINSSGNVGIGTTSPNHKLHVSGNALVTNLYVATKVIHDGDEDTAVSFSTNEVGLEAGGVQQLSVTSDNVNITDTLSYDYPAALDSTAYNGEIVTFGTFVSGGTAGANGTIAAGDVIVYTTNGLASGWTRAQGSISYGKGMLGIAMGTSASDGVLIKGFAKNAVFNSGGLGSVLYLDPSNAGDTTSTIPGSTNNIVRIVGYMVDASSDVIFFDPDKSWVQVS